jgi:hypothetical protein
VLFACALVRRAIAGGPSLGYNLQPNKSSSQRC